VDDDRFAVDEIVTPVSDAGCVRIVVEVHPERGWIRVEDRDVTDRDEGHGYYVPAQDLLAGDPRLAAEAKRLFESYELPRDAKGRYQGGKFDGCSVFQKADGVTRRVMLEDFFSETFRVLTHDLPAQWKRSAWLDPMLWERFRG
jgi:hypothetical protein